MVHSAMTDETRLCRLNHLPARAGRYVLYWMQASQRGIDNPALDRAVERADELDLPALAVFGLDAAYPEANLRSFTFLLEGLRVARRDLEHRGVQLAVIRTSPDEAALSLAAEAALVVCDRGVLRHQRAWRERVAAAASCPVEQVDGDAVVPLDAASRKAEWAAATLRPKILRLRDRYLAAAAALDATSARRGSRKGRSPLGGPLHRPRRDSLGIDVPGNERDLGDRFLDGLPVDRTVSPVPDTRGGTDEALARLSRFVAGPLVGYAEENHDPTADAHSGLAPYLHFGQVSPVRVALAARDAGAPGGATEAFLEQLIVRRELAANLALFNDRCDRFEGVPDWARATLAAHARDPRPHRYGRADLEAARTHDPYWNAAMRAMRLTGFLHNHLRMYWGKKILEWSATPEEGFRTALALNNRWFLDGRDANSLAGVAWVFGTHDRAWPERPIFGKIRFMNDAGLRRKFDADGWAASVPPLAEEG
jgi:deoxyribodipyrimidine photo-lyase